MFEPSLQIHVLFSSNKCKTKLKHIYKKSRELFWTSQFAVVFIVVARTSSCFDVANDTQLAVCVLLVLTHIKKKYIYISAVVKYFCSHHQYDTCNRLRVIVEVTLFLACVSELFWRVHNRNIASWYK